MDSKLVMKRVYRDGHVDGFDFNYPLYIMYKHVPDDTDPSYMRKIYSIVAIYSDGESTNNWVFDNPRIALSVFRNLVH